MDSFSRAIQKNKEWARSFRSKNPELMHSLSQAQKPEILWIGCSDSRLPETTLLDLEPGQVFVHRNVANIVYPGDLSSAAVIEYAINALGVKHIVLCGHTGCGGVVAALDNKSIGLIDAWLMPLRNLRYRFHDELAAMKPADRVPRLVRENVLQGVEVLRENPNVLKAQLDGKLSVHGLIYDLATGELEELNTDIADEELEKMRHAFKVA
jgi:carbonic anhydrase